MKTIIVKKITSFILITGLFSTLLAGNIESKNNITKFHFTVTSDSHMGRSYADYAKFVCPAILANPNGPGAFMVNTGDFDVFSRVNKTITEQLIEPLKAQGKSYYWYPIPGNHDIYNTSNDPAFRTEVAEDTQTRKLIEYNRKNLKHIVNWGPKFDSKLIGYENNGSQYTTYSFDYGNCHFIALDLFYANSVPARGCGNFSKTTEAWLIKDLDANKKPNIIVFGHHPILKFTGVNGKEVQKKNLMNFRRQQLWDVLKKYKVSAYFCGHVHNYGVRVKDGISQITNGKSGLKSKAAYVMVFVDGDKISYKSYAYSHGSWQEYSGKIKPAPQNTVSTQATDSKKTADKTVPQTAPSINIAIISDTPAPKALIGYWNFDSDSADRAHDSGSQGYFGYIKGNISYVPGVSDKAIALNGKDAFIQIAAKADKWRQLKGLTLMGWFFREDGAEGVTGLDKAQNYRLTSSPAGNSGAKWSFWLKDNKGGHHSVTTPQAIPNGEWHHIAATHDGNELKIYVDGIEVKSQQVTFTIKDTKSNFEIGRRDGARYFKGKIDEVRAYNRALTKDEIVKAKGLMVND